MVRGVVVRRREIEVAILAEWLLHKELSSHEPRDFSWPGQFSLLGVPLVVAGCLANRALIYFFVGLDYHLIQDASVLPELALRWQTLRVVGLLGKTW